VSNGHSPPPDEELPPEPLHLRGLKMTYAERLRWLEEAKRSFGRLLGRARQAGGTPRTPPDGQTPG